MNFTMEERCLLAAYGGGSRAALTAGLCASLADLEESDMRELAMSAAAKLDGITDAEFEALDLAPEFDFDSDDAGETEDNADGE